jgi:glycosyltransferase involved in cell wall biosynthesis
MALTEARTWAWVVRTDRRHRASRRVAAAGLDLAPLHGVRARPGAVWAVGVVHDEADIIRATVGNFVEQGVERVVVADRSSTDGTPDLVRGIPGVTVLADGAPEHLRGHTLTLLARAAARAGAEWVVPFDADELWTAPGGLAAFLASTPADVVRADVWEYVPTVDDPVDEADPTERIRHRRTTPTDQPRWAFRAHRLAFVGDDTRVVRAGATTTGLRVARFTRGCEGPRSHALRSEGPTVREPFSAFRDRASTRPRILVVTKLSPTAPASGSVLRVRHTADALAHVGEVDCLWWSPVPWNGERSTGVTEVPWDGPSPNGRLVRAAALGVPSRLNRTLARAWVATAQLLGPSRVSPFEIARSGRPRGRMMRRLTQMVEAYDLVWFFKLDPAVALPPLFDAAPRKVVDLDDLLRLTFEARGDASTFERLDHAAWAAHYRDVSTRADLLTASNPDEAARLGPHVVVVPNGATLPDRTVVRAPGSRPVLTFVGLMKYAANSDGATWLVEEIVPELRAVLGDDFEVRIVGEASADVQRLSSDPNVEVVGYVDDLDRELERCDLAIVPLRLGTGTRLKILEAFARALPVVATTIAADGLDVVAGEHLLVADTPSEFAMACVRALHDHELRVRLTTAARRLVASSYDWRLVEEQIATLAAGLIRRPTHAANPMELDA